MLVNKETDSISLSDKVICSDDSTWKLYYDRLGQTEIPTKIAAGMGGFLSQGDNLFYVVVTSQNGTQMNVYELNVFRSYPVSVFYAHGEEFLDMGMDTILSNDYLKIANVVKKWKENHRG